ncbi:MAG: hypothetical protein HQK65_00560 [Desulfamplus sp.]|nr:hypothetical protein [Desulfamplus sp.]
MKRQDHFHLEKIGKDWWADSRLMAQEIGVPHHRMLEDIFCHKAEMDEYGQPDAVRFQVRTLDTDGDDPLTVVDAAFLSVDHVYYLLRTLYDSDDQLAASRFRLRYEVAIDHARRSERRSA